jgi:hypothetical protein
VNAIVRAATTYIDETAVAWVVYLAPGFLVAVAVPGKAGLFAVGLGLAARAQRPQRLPEADLPDHGHDQVPRLRGQAIDAAWDAHLGAASEGFRQIGERVRSWVAGPAQVDSSTPAAGSAATR